MIHYHGISDSGSIKDTLRLAKGRHCFVSYAKAGRLAAISHVCQSFALDNGAFSAWRSERPFDYEGFVKFVELWGRHPACDFIVLPDVIDGDEEDNDAFIKRWPKHLRSMAAPVWHLHESFERLHSLASEWRLVCLGSSGTYSQPNSESWWRRIDQALEAITDEHGVPKCKLHGLRMLDPRVFSRMPLSSADSTNAERNGLYEQKFGNYVPPTRGQRAEVIAERIESQQAAARWMRLDQLEFSLGV